MIADQLLTIGEVVRLTRLAMPTVYRRMAEGAFPRPVRLGRRAVRWGVADVQGWLESLNSERGPERG